MSIQNTILEARKRGASDDEILAKIYQANPDTKFRENLTAQLSNKSASDILKDFGTPAKEKSPGLIQGIAQSITKPGLKIVETGRDIIRSAGNIGLSLGAKALGKDEKAQEYLDKAGAATKTPGDYGYLGKVDSISGMKDAIATGVEAGTTLATLSTAVPKTLLARSLLYGTTGAVTAGAREVQEGGDLSSVASAAKGGGIAGATVPVALAGFNTFVTKPTLYLLQKLGAGLSGQSSKGLTAIYKGGAESQKAATEIKKGGAVNILKRNSETIMNGIAKVKQEARAMYGKAVESLKATDIDDKAIKTSVANFFKDNGITVKNGTVNLDATEIISPEVKNKLAKVLVDINKSKITNGADLRNLSTTIEKYMFKSPGSDADRLAYNQILQQLQKTFVSSIKDPNGILAKANESFTKDMGLSESMEEVFGKVQFKNPSELLAISKKLDNLFAMKGLSMNEIEKFLTRIGISPTTFKAQTALQQGALRGTAANAPGASMGELTGIATSAVLPPELVQNIAIKSGIAAEKLGPIMEKLAPAKMKALIELFTD
jgi:hypothetical protein